VALAWLLHGRFVAEGAYVFITANATTRKAPSKSLSKET